MSHPPRYRRAPGAATASVDGDTVVVSPADLRYHALNRSGAGLWSVLVDPVTVDEIVGHLTARFEVDDGRCRVDVEDALAHFAEIGIVEVV